MPINTSPFYQEAAQANSHPFTASGRKS